MELADYLEENGLSQEAFAKSVDVTQGAVSQWLTGATKISPEIAKKVERVTAGKVRREDLRPDIFGKAA